MASSYQEFEQGLAEHYAAESMGCPGVHAERLVARFEAAVERVVQALDRSE